MDNLKKWIRRILNILFAIFVISSIYIGWGREVDDPDAWFPEWVDEPAQTQSASPESESQK